MAKPRVFISSTFYDLKQIREDLERSIKELGYEPVRNEKGSIPYGKEEAPEAYAYKELQLCDIIVSIIGGRYGTPSRHNDGHSISQTELKKALELGIQVFIFIEKSVHAEYETYILNKKNPTTKYRFVDNIKIYKFLEGIHDLPRNNPITTFEMSADITDYLRSQWAGLFKQFLQQEKRHSEIVVLEEMRQVSNTLNDLVKYLTEEKRSGNEAINSILMLNHPAFRRFKEVTNTPYRVCFVNREELTAWLSERGFKALLEGVWDDQFHEEYVNTRLKQCLKVDQTIFGYDGKLKIMTDEEWKNSWVMIEKHPNEGPHLIPPEEDDEDRPY